MTKQNYEKEPYGEPVMEIIELEDDAITTSGCNPYGYCGDSGNCPPVGVCADDSICTDGICIAYGCASYMICSDCSGDSLNNQTFCTANKH